MEDRRVAAGQQVPHLLGLLGGVDNRERSPLHLYENAEFDVWDV
jgi:hypothetical protein